MPVEKHTTQRQKEASQPITADAEVQPVKKLWLRGVFILLALLCLVLGTIGIVVPGLPTVDFYLLASFFAAKGSRRLHRWITQNRFIGPLLIQWREQRTIPKKVKVISLLSMSIAALLIVYSIPHIWLVVPLLLMMLAVQIWMWTCA